MIMFRWKNKQLRNRIQTFTHTKSAFTIKIFMNKYHIIINLGPRFIVFKPFKALDWKVLIAETLQVFFDIMHETFGRD